MRQLDGSRHVPALQDKNPPRRQRQRSTPLRCSLADALWNRMQLDQEIIDDFKAAYRTDFGEDLSDAEAAEVASRVLDLYLLLARRVPEEGSHPTG